MNVEKTYISRIKKMSPSQRLLIAIELTQTVREIATKGIMDSLDVSRMKAKKILQKRLFK